MSWRFCLAVAAFVPALALASASTARTSPACGADLAAVDASFEETLARLEAAWKGEQEEKCAAIRHHIEVMTNAGDVFMRCLTGMAQRENVGQMSDSIEDFTYVLADQGCEEGPPAKP